MSLLSDSQSTTTRKIPRRSRMGGFEMSVKTATAWASRIIGEDLDPQYDSSTVWQVIFDKVRPYRVNFTDVGEVAGLNYMLITQSAKFRGYRGMDPALIPQFEEGEREAIARKVLAAEDVHDFEFKTVLA